MIEERVSLVPVPQWRAIALMYLPFDRSDVLFHSSLNSRADVMMPIMFWYTVSSPDATPRSGIISTELVGASIFASSKTNPSKVRVRSSASFAMVAIAK